MKKLLIIGLVGLLGLVASAQVAPRSYRMIPSDINSLIVSNTIAITNLSSVAALITTNKTGTAWTNSAGIGVVASSGSTTKLLQDVPLWSLRDGSGAWSTITNNSIPFMQSYATLAVTGTAGSGANAAVTFVMAPVYGTREATDAGQLWTFSLTPTASTTQTMVTNVPMFNWPGATALRCRRIVNADTDASSQWVLSDITLNGYIPQ